MRTIVIGYLLIAVVMVSANACSKLGSENEKISYVVGFDTGRAISGEHQKAEVDSFIEAVGDIYSGKKLKYDDKQIDEIINKIYDRKNKKAAENVDMKIFSYAIGSKVAKNMKRDEMEIEQKAFGLGFGDGFKNKSPELSMKEMKEVYQKFRQLSDQKSRIIAERNLKTGREFLEKNKQNKNVTTTKSGLQYEVLSMGGGAMPQKQSTVKVHYKGTLIDGTEFDSSYKRNQPAEFKLDQVIPGWTEGLQLMKAGSKFRFWIPPDIAYGERTQSSIPGNSVLIFEVELLEIKR